MHYHYHGVCRLTVIQPSDFRYFHVVIQRPKRGHGSTRKNLPSRPPQVEVPASLIEAPQPLPLAAPYH